jgi:hypothetical protein
MNVDLEVPVNALPQGIDIVEPLQEEVITTSNMLFYNMDPQGRVEELHKLLWSRPLLAARVMVRLDALRRHTIRQRQRDREMAVRRVRRAIANGGVLWVAENGRVHVPGVYGINREPE